MAWLAAGHRQRPGSKDGLPSTRGAVLFYQRHGYAEVEFYPDVQLAQRL
ncbi:hypothetical protein ACU4GD_44910 [Cupriavidus basilensis]